MYDDFVLEGITRLDYSIKASHLVLGKIRARPGVFYTAYTASGYSDLGPAPLAPVGTERPFPATIEEFHLCPEFTYV